MSYISFQPPPPPPVVASASNRTIRDTPGNNSPSVLSGYSADVRPETSETRACCQWFGGKSVSNRPIDHWMVTKPAQGIYSAVRISGESQYQDVCGITGSGKPEIPSDNHAAIKLLKEIKSENILSRHVENAIRDLQRTDVSPGSSTAFSEVIYYLIFFTLQYAENGSLLDKLLELGWEAPIKKADCKLMSFMLLKKVCEHSQNPKEFARANTLNILTYGTEESLHFLMEYQSEQDIMQTILKSHSHYISVIFGGFKGYMGVLPDTCPQVVKLVWKALLPRTSQTLEVVVKEQKKGNMTPFAGANHWDDKAMLIATLIWLDYHHPETILPLLKQMPIQQLNVLRLISLSLGLEHLSFCIAKTNLSPLSANKTDLLHQLVHFTSKMGRLYLNAETFTSLTPLFNASGLSVEDIKKLASRRDEVHHLPLQMLLEEQLACACADPFFYLDKSRFQSWFDFLVQHTPKVALPDCLSTLLRSKEPKNINCYQALLRFRQAGCDLSKVPLEITPGPVSDEWNGDLPARDSTDNSSTILALLQHFQQYPDTLSHPGKTDQMVRSLNLSPAFQAVTLLAMSRSARQELIALWRKDPDRMKSLFLDRCFSMTQSYTGPWLPFMVIMQHDLPPVTDTTAAAALETHVDQFMAGLGEQGLADLPSSLMSDWQKAEQLDIYGRSLRVCKKRKGSSNTEDNCQSFRLKFRKKSNAAPEPWAEFIREQAVLSALEAGELPLHLESGLLKAGGVYRLPEARSILSRDCFIPEPLQQTLLEKVHVEPEGHAYVQVLKDTPDTEHYHHYPYLIDPETGLTRESAFEGIRLYCRDSGRLWRAGIKSPDAIGVFHNQTGSKPWNPLAGYTLRRQGLFCTSSLCAWNAQIPDIAHAPAGMRDFQGVMAMERLPSDIYGERSLDWNNPRDVRCARLVELAKQFYGATLNWLRVRHDLKELDHTRPEHLQSLSRELVTLYKDLFTHAFGGSDEFWASAFLQRLPEETLHQAVRECLYWCSPQYPYVADIHTNRFPSEVYPEHHHSDLKLDTDYLFEDGFKSHPDAAGFNLGHADRGNFALHHLAPVLWLGLMEGVWLLNNTRSGIGRFDK